MQLTPNYKMKKPESTDPVNIQDLNDNADILDAELKKKTDSSGGDMSEMVVKTLDNVTAEFPVPVAGEKTRTFLGKVRKFIADFNAFKTGILTMGQLVNNCVTDNPKLPLAAAQGKALMDLYTQLNTNLNQIKLKRITKQNVVIRTPANGNRCFYGVLFYCSNEGLNPDKVIALTQGGWSSPGANWVVYLEDGAVLAVSDVAHSVSYIEVIVAYI